MALQPSSRDKAPSVPLTFRARFSARLAASFKIGKSLLVLALWLVALIGVENLVLQRLGTTSVASAVDLAVSSLWPVKDRAAIVLFDGKDQDIDAGWPLGYARWENVAVKAWCAGARVLVFDIGFSHPGTPKPDGDDTRAHFAATLMALSGLPDEDSAKLKRADLFRDHCVPADPSQANLFGRRTPSPMPVVIGPAAGGYDLPALQELVGDASWDRDGTYRAIGDTGAVTLGLQAARDWCERGGDATGCKAIDQVPARTLVRDTVTTPAEQVNFSVPEVGPTPWTPPACYYRGGTKSLWLLASAALRGPLLDWSTCPPVPLMTHAQFDDPRSPLASTLSGRIVFVGSANLSGLNDTADTALHRALPGVVIHALAADGFLDGVARTPLPPDFVILGLLVPVVFLALAARLARPMVFLGNRPAVDQRSDTVAFAACALVMVGCSTFGWPILPVAGWALLVFIALGGTSFDPAERVVSKVESIRRRVYGDAARAIRHQGPEGKGRQHEDSEG